jgi:Zn-dependent protease
MLMGQAESTRQRAGPVQSARLAGVTRRGASPVFLALVGVTVAGGALTCVDASGAITAGIVLLVLGGWAVSLCLHEFGHAYTALRGGDTSVRDKGYLTLDIRRYTDPVLSIVLPLVLLLVGGLPLPGGAVWINHHALRSRAVQSAVSLAGPGANLAIGVLLTIAVTAVSMPDGLRWGLSWLALVQVLAFVLNMLPVPGLDGFGAIDPYLPYEWRRIAAIIRPWAPLALFALLISVPGLARPLFDLSYELFTLIGGDRSAAAEGLDRFLFWR